jgi:hypothetical protein
MAKSGQRIDELVVSSNFIRAVRESGYLSLSTALAELIDNSLEAEASEVSISIERETPTALPAITVIDNGVGMTRTELENCLRFGGSSRFDTRESFGRFGMGLPAASLSQARRVEVTSWRGRGEYRVSLDVDAITEGRGPGLVARRVGAGRSTSGTRVCWSECDRIEYRRLAWLERALRRDLGRMYRRFIRNGVSLKINGVPVDAFDPLLLDAEFEGSRASLAFEPITYEIESVSGELSTVTVNFSMLPVHAWHHLDNATKRRIGVVGQGGVSILRAGREIASGWHLMGSKRKENYDDWWRCEIDFDPVLDDHFGITINKQGIRPSTTLSEALEPEMEAIARLLNARVREAFEEVKFQAAAATSCRIAHAAEAVLPPIRGRRVTGPINYRLGSAALPNGEMLTHSLERQTLDVTLSTDHPAFAALFGPLETMGDSDGNDLRPAVELLLISHIRACYQMGVSGTDMLRAWGETYSRMLQRA